MNEEEFFEQSTDFLKRKLIAKYVFLMLIILGLYSLIFYFIIQEKLFSYYTFAYFCMIAYTWLLLHKSYDIKTIVHIHLVSAPLFAAFIMLNLWEYSIASCMWLLPVPLGAYIFLGKKAVYIYTFYVLAIILGCNFLTHSFDFNFLSFKNKNLLKISDTFVFVSNIAVFSLLIYYKDKIRRVEIESKFVKKIETLEENLNSIQNAVEDESNENIQKYNFLFGKVKQVIEEESYFKEADFTISKLATILNTNNVYISKAIKLNSYTNFNHYLNTCRVNNVKKLIQENDLNKITLMYIYTASGFSNQSTFNRVFKQIEGITPSEYIQNLNLKVL